MSGRKQMTNVYDELNFMPLKEGPRKYFAMCMVCNKKLANVAVNRLIQHRKICPGRTKYKHIISTPSTCHQKDIEFLDIQAHPTFLNTINQNDSSSFIKQESTSPDLFGESSFYNSTTVDQPTTSNQSQYQSNSSSVDCVANLNEMGSSSEEEDQNITEKFIPKFQPNPTPPPLPRFQKFSFAKTKHDIKSTMFTSKIGTIEPGLSDKETFEISTSIANFFFACNIPLSIIESPHFKNMITNLRPAYSKHIPNHKQLSTQFLDHSYSQCISNSTRSLSKKSVLLVDSWKNTMINSETVISIVHSSNNSICRAFVKANDMTDKSQVDGDQNMKKFISTSSDDAKKLYNTEIYAAVSDRTNIGEGMNKNQGNELWHITCNCHISNLLINDITNPTILENLSSISNEFKSFEDEIVDRGGFRLHLPCNITLNTLKRAYSNFIKNKNILKHICLNNHYSIKVEVHNLIQNDEFIKLIENELQILDRISRLTDKLRNKDCRLDEAAHLWLDFELTTNGLPLHEEKVKLRKDMALSKYALTAYYLNPHYDKTKLTPNHKLIINKFLLNHLSNVGLNSVYEYENGRDIFQILNDRHIEKPEVYWSLVKEIHSELAELAALLFAVPASSAQVERVFSNWHYVYSNIKNRLTSTKASKLRHIYFSIKNIDQLTMEEISENECD